ncbi:MAG: GAF domain-containing protein [Planctomycetaceae bacterium]|nr:GAF domain-containing protein [Planctomycetaceae bacterium]
MAVGNDQDRRVADLDRHVADLEKILDVTRALGVTVDLDPLLAQIATAATDVLDCERATVFLCDHAKGELFSRIATGMEGAPIEEIRFGMDRGIAGEVATTAKGINIPDPYNDSRFNPDFDRKSGFVTKSLLTLPLGGHDGKIVGVIQVLNKLGGPFGDRDERLLSALGAQAGVAIERQGLLEQYAVKQRIERDLNIAREIQQGLLPKTPPDLPGFEIAGWNRSADETGGDCYDWLRLPGGLLAISIGDATGHGIGPALVAAEARALLRGTLMQSRDLARVVPQINDLLGEDLREGTFVTAFIGLLDPVKSSVEYVSAGHGPLLVYTAVDDSFTEIPTHGLPLGLMPEVEFDPATHVPLALGDMLLLFTDGFFEWSRPDGEQFGTDRLTDVVRRHRDLPVAEVIALVYAAVVEFSEGTKQADDCTAVIVKRVSTTPS